MVVCSCSSRSALAGAAEAHRQQPQQAGQQDLPPGEEDKGPVVQPQPDHEGELCLRKV